MKLDWFFENASTYQGTLSENEPLSKYTYYRIGGPARLLAFPKTEADLHWLARGIQATGVPYFILGAGSNILVSDKGFSGLVIRMGRANLGVEEEGPSQLRIGASVAVSTLLRRCAQEGWGGLEFLSGVPGSMGGVAVMNAGTHLGEFKDAVKAIRILCFSKDKLETYGGAALKYEYRKNHFIKTGEIVWDVLVGINREDPTLVKSRIDETLQRRKSTQPVDFPSCGSVFKNPKAHGQHAWQVIDKLGLRGHRIGNAQIAAKHSNFIINLGNASAADVRGLIELAKKRAGEELQIPLEEEVMYVGDW